MANVLMRGLLGDGGNSRVLTQGLYRDSNGQQMMSTMPEEIRSAMNQWSAKRDDVTRYNNVFQAIFKINPKLADTLLDAGDDYDAYNNALNKAYPAVPVPQQTYQPKSGFGRYISGLMKSGKIKFPAKEGSKMML